MMKRRDFLKGAAIGAGALASGMLPGKGGANPSPTIRNRKQGADFYKIDAFSHFAPVSYLDYLRSLGGPPSLLQAYGKAWPEFSDVHGLQPRLKMMEDEGIDISIIFPQPDLEGGLGPVFMADGKALSAAVFINDTMSKCVRTPLNSSLPLFSRSRIKMI